MEKSAVSSYDEWTQLEEVVVGSVEGFSGFHMDYSFELGCLENLFSKLRSKGDGEER